jgi:hypothetical protein
MKECDNSIRKIHTSSNFILSISLLIMFDTLLLRPSLICNTPLHFITLHYTSQHLSTFHFLSFIFTCLHFLSTLHYTSHFTQLHFTTLIDIPLPLIYLYVFTFPIRLFHLTSLNKIQYNFHLQTYFQNNEPLHCPKELLNISLHFRVIRSLNIQTVKFYPRRNLKLRNLQTLV